MFVIPRRSITGTRGSPAVTALGPGLPLYREGRGVSRDTGREGMPKQNLGWWIRMGGPSIAFSGLSRRSSFFTNTSGYLSKKYSLAAEGDVVLWSGSGGDTVRGGVGAPEICVRHWVTPSSLLLLDSMTLLAVLRTATICSGKFLGTTPSALQ
ncbi:hypothetical protein GWK47_012125 [Chionoecetes opilio]|uniref:Uncharacterized protein n=1 Tax=Chionoecetes opilio TaxID=41210 RepID=A0A8J4XX04_CHIOP|nr:hypothetical protein GWK47_012125 [Chionoecetes opilio]